MTFPIVKNKQALSSPLVCPSCHSEIIGEPNSFAVLSGGAFLMDKSRQSGGKSDQMDGYLSLIWHGAHGAGQGQDRDIYESVPLAEDIHGGQFEVYFCSIKCLQAFLNSWVDELEDRVQSATASPPAV